MSMHQDTSVDWSCWGMGVSFLLGDPQNGFRSSFGFPLPQNKGNQTQTSIDAPVRRLMKPTPHHFFVWGRRSKKRGHTYRAQISRDAGNGKWNDPRKTIPNLVCLKGTVGFVPTLSTCRAKHRCPFSNNLIKSRRHWFRCYFSPMYQGHLFC